MARRLLHPCHSSSVLRPSSLCFYPLSPLLVHWPVDYNFTRFLNVFLTYAAANLQRMLHLRMTGRLYVFAQGRLIDHLRNSQSVGLEDLQALVLDEADRLLQMGFSEEVEP